jgi:hypothetical protein
MRTTEKELQALVLRYQQAITKFTGEVPELELNMGSKANGISFRLYHLIRENGVVVKKEPAWGTPHAIWSDGFLGWTKGEAYNTLATATLAIEAATEYMF